MGNCLICSAELPKGRKKFCCQQHAMKWHNDRQVWLERPDRELHNARKKSTPEQQAERMRAWRAKNPEAQKAIERRHREIHKPEIAADHAAWRAKNRAYVLERSAMIYYETRTKTPWKHILRSRLRDAMKRGIPFELTAKWAEARWTGCCELSGIPFDLTRSVVGFYSPSIDKIKAELGYLPHNCRFVLFSINAFKNNGTDADVFAACRAILERSAAQIISEEPRRGFCGEDVITDDDHTLLSDLAQWHE